MIGNRIRKLIRNFNIIMRNDNLNKLSLSKLFKEYNKTRKFIKYSKYKDIDKLLNKKNNLK